MNLLTADEIDAALGCVSFGGQLDARKIEAAVIKKLAAGVDVEPRYHITTDCDSKIKHIPHYTPDQLQTAIAAARVKAVNECAVAAWIFHMDKSKKGGISPAVFEAWSPVSAIWALIGANK